jgi:hypothetical protein
MGDAMGFYNTICASIKWVSILALKDVITAWLGIAPLIILMLSIDTLKTLIYTPLKSLNGPLIWL